MKVIAKKTILMRVNEMLEECRKKGVEVVRVEMSYDEFLGLTKAVEDSASFRTYIARSNWGSIKSGSYLVYKDVCFQYHEDYPKVKDTVEYI